MRLFTPAITKLDRKLNAGWTCQQKRCGHRNLPHHRLCKKCGKRGRPTPTQERTARGEL